MDLDSIIGRVVRIPKFFGCSGIDEIQFQKSIPHCCFRFFFFFFRSNEPNLAMQGIEVVESILIIFLLETRHKYLSNFDYLAKLKRFVGLFFFFFCWTIINKNSYFRCANVHCLCGNIHRKLLFYSSTSSRA